MTERVWICKNCEWWFGNMDGEQGQCRIEPPRFDTAQIVNAWPYTMANAWCSEFEKRGELDADN
jgi:hypothetical protein